jgi:uncharacterized protein (DUF2267 family)
MALGNVQWSRYEEGSMAEETDTQTQAEDSFTKLPLWEDLTTRRIELQGSTIYQAFLNDLRRIGEMEHDFAETAAASVLCTFDQHLRAGRVKDPDADLPAPLLELFTGCERSGEPAPSTFSRDEFVSTVADDLDCDDYTAETIIRHVFEATRRQLKHESVLHIGRKLPVAVQALWFAHQGKEH